MPWTPCMTSALRKERDYSSENFMSFPVVLDMAEEEAFQSNLETACKITSKPKTPV